MKKIRQQAGPIIYWNINTYCYDCVNLIMFWILVNECVSCCLLGVAWAFFNAIFSFGNIFLRTGNFNLTSLFQSINWLTPVWSCNGKKFINIVLIQYIVRALSVYNDIFIAFIPWTFEDHLWWVHKLVVEINLMFWGNSHILINEHLFSSKMH